MVAVALGALGGEPLYPKHLSVNRPAATAVLSQFWLLGRIVYVSRSTNIVHAITPL